jgi:large subunit ribosomal protein L6e
MPRLAKSPWRKNPTRNPFLIKGVERFGRSAAKRRNGQWAKKSSAWKAAATQKKPAEKKEKKFGGGQRAIQTPKAPRSYPEEDIRHPLASRKSHHKPPALRQGIVPGSVLILLSGRFRGKRVVFLKQLKSGLLLVTGPYKINGVPLRRVNQAYVIRTRTHVSIQSKLDLLDSVDDKFFRKKQAKKPSPAEKKSEENFFKKGKEKKVIDEARKDMQKKVDGLLLAVIKKEALLKHYLGSRFSLHRKQYPHLLQF